MIDATVTLLEPIGEVYRGLQVNLKRPETCTDPTGNLPTRGLTFHEGMT
ncbi:hypothetical protein NKDENANG_01693 [Candidatus Entotheonellaceae bacterium PAL068K]